ncbi:LOW QUALITY PROTEIN: protein NDNF-like [Palaemon carinicauda]|uniref:LOW QUALITY PROTEIN: protein NDNF-like n=1 Tax=Palaemon carinicauda TaxID=392227 RepID=UPI0035B5A9F7
MEKRYTILQSLLSISIYIAVATGPSNSTTPTNSDSSKKLTQSQDTISSSSTPSSSAHLSSSSNDVYPRNTSEEDIRAYQLVEELLTEEDRSYDVKVLPSGREVSTYILQTEIKRLLFPMVEKGPLTIIVTPCASPLSWTLSLRLWPSSKNEEYVNSKTTWMSDGEHLNNITQDDDFYESYLYDYNMIARDPKMFESRSVFDDYKNSRLSGRRVRELRSDSDMSSKFVHTQKKRYETRKRKTYFGRMAKRTDISNEYKALKRYPNSKLENNVKVNEIFQRYNRRKKGWTPDSYKSDASASFRGIRRHGPVRKRSVRVKEVILKIYEGHDSIVFQRQSMPSGLYVLQVMPLWRSTYMHIKAKKDWSPVPVIAPVSSTSSTSPEGIMLRWSPSVSATGYCLVISEGRSFPSLCAARAAREENLLYTGPKKTIPRYRNLYRETSRLRTPTKNPMLLMGCTEHNWYRLSHAPSNTLHVAVWEENGIGGPPMGRGIVRPSRRAKVPRLRPGELMTLVPSAGGSASVKFKVRKKGRRLHIMAVTCSTQLHLNVKTRHGNSLGSAAGDPGCLHLVLRDLPQASLTFSLKTDPPGAGNSIMITAAHNTRTLALPRLPRRAVVKISNVTCTSALVKWFKAPGNASHCVLVKRLRNGATWTERTARQCGWETLLEKSWLFVDKWCGHSVVTKKQTYKTEALSPGAAYSVTVLVRHGITGRILAMPPKRIQTSNCHLL